MHIAERWQDNLQPIKNAMRRVQSRIWTTLPCIVIAVDASRQTVTVQSAVAPMKRTQDPANGRYSWQPYPLPPLAGVPIKYPSGGGWTLTFPIKPGDEGTITFASRCIDNWWVGGGVQPELSPNGAGWLRMHHLSDGFFELGGRSQPNEIASVSASSVQIRDDAGKNTVSFDAEAGFAITMPGGFMRLDASGNLTVSGKITAGYGGGDSVTLQQHTHNQPPDSHGDAQRPTDPPNAGT